MSELEFAMSEQMRLTAKRRYEAEQRRKQEEQKLKYASWLEEKKKYEAEQTKGTERQELRKSRFYDVTLRQIVGFEYQTREQAVKPVKMIRTYEFAPVKMPTDWGQTLQNLMFPWTRQPSPEEELHKSIAFYRKIGYPQYGGRYDPFEIPQGYILGGLAETTAGLHMWFAPTTETVEIEPEASRFYNVTFRQMVSFEYQVREQAVQPVRLEYEAMMVPVGTVSYEAMERRFRAIETIQQKESQLFYRELGYPAFGGKYQPFEMPEGLRVEKIREKPEGLEVLFEPDIPFEFQHIYKLLREPTFEKLTPSLTERILGLQPTPTAQEQALMRIFRGATRTEGTKGVEAIAGIVAVPEATLYSIARLAKIETPSIPPTLTGALVSKYAFGRSEQMEWMQEHPSYMAGSLLGEIGLSWAIGKAATTAWKKVRGVKAVKMEGAAEIEKAIAKEGVLDTQRITKLTLVKEHVPSKYADWLDEMQRYFQPETIHLAGKEKLVIKGGEEFVFLKKPVEAMREAMPYIAAAKEKPHLLYELIHLEAAGLPTAERLAVRQFTGVQIFGKIDPQVYLRFVQAVPPAVAQSWYMQMGGIATSELAKLGSEAGVHVITKIVAVETPTALLPTIATVTGTAVLRGLPKEPMIVKPASLRQLEKQSEKLTSFMLPEVKQRLVSIPTRIPSVVSRGEILPTVTVAQFSRQFEKAISIPHIISVQERKPSRQLRPDIELAPQILFKERERQILMPKISFASFTGVRVKAIVTTVQRPMQMLEQVGKTTPRLPSLDFRRIGLSKKQQKALFGKWFYRRHPLATPEEAMRRITGMSTKKRRRKK